MQDNNLSSKSKELNNYKELRVTVNDPQCREREVGTDSRLTVFKYSVAL